MSNSWNDKRPMSPHLQVWRWHPAMLGSILHRISSVICYIGFVKISFGLLILALTGKLPLEGVIYSPLGFIGLALFTFALVYLGLAQLCRLIWLRGKMLSPSLNNKLSLAMVLISVVLAIMVPLAVLGSIA